MYTQKTINKSEYNHLLTEIKKKKVKIGIVGIGYVGLKLLIQFCNQKFHTIGIDQDIKKIKLLKKNKSPISYINNYQIAKIKKHAQYFSEIKNIEKCDVIILCLPTPLKNKKPDLSHVTETMKLLVKYLKRYQILILESTTYPGTTEEIIKPYLDKKFNVGDNFFLGYSPERENPGDKNFSFDTNS